MATLKSDAEIIAQVYAHIDNRTTDLGEGIWKEPTSNYTSDERFAAELLLLKHLPVVFAPSVALTDPGSYVAHPVAGVPVIVVRDHNKTLRAFRNACRHRGVMLIEGQGRTNVFRCPYHGWAYGTDGTLQHVPHEAGFPALDKCAYGLTEIHDVREVGGLVFVCLEEPVDDGALSDLPTLLPDDHLVFDYHEDEKNFNWKLNIEATLEGYHIKPTHEQTFYPYGYDNLNVVENFGRNSRITFPFRRIEDLRETPADERDIVGKVTYVYNVFPIGTVAVLSNHISVLISEPVAPGKTYYFSYRLGRLKGDETEERLEKMKRDASFVADTGLAEDNAIVAKIQRGLDSEANQYFTYGLYEKAIIQLLRNLDELISQPSQV